MVSSPEKIRMDNIPVIMIWARRFAVPKKNVKPMVRAGAAEKHQPDDPRHDARGHDEPGATRLSDKV